jgi:hypothetical protein
MSSTEMIYGGISEGLTTPRDDFGEAAGEAVMALGEHRGLATDDFHVYDQVVAAAAIADLVVTAIRKHGEDPWGIPEPSKWADFTWQPSCFVVGDVLRRVVLVSNWSDERHYSEVRSWWSIGEVCAAKMPMQQVVVILGPTRNGRRHGAWSKCFQHPMNGVIRFRKKSRSTSEVFKESWQEIWRVDHAEITNQVWLQAMLKDDVLPEVCFKVDVPVPDAKQCQRIRDMAARKMERLQEMREKPEANLSSCDWPTPCVFRKMCHTIPERNPSEKNGFIFLLPRQATVKHLEH